MIDAPAERIWSRLRATRSDPPGGASRGAERRQTYVFALEQAEQLFRAAAGSGVATRPLLVFYGLSQAGRAIAAASLNIADDEGWRLAGHGIKCTPDSLRGPLPDIQIRADRLDSKGSFVRLCHLLGSPLWGNSDPLLLNVAWDCLPETRLTPLRDDGESRRVPLYVNRPDLFVEPHPLASLVVGNFPPWVVRSRQGFKAFTDFMSSFPEARGYHSYHRLGPEPDSDPDFDYDVAGWGELQMNWELPPDARLARGHS